jgi:dTDP-4-amino-4,6-dideoxygalactose transaminase
MKQITNFYPKQYLETGRLPINHNYLDKQFSDMDEIWEKIREVVVRGDFTLGSDVDKLESEFAQLNQCKHAIGVGSGTDAIFLSLKALGIGEGDEVITTAFTFYATIGAICTTGAKPIFVDILDDYNIDPKKIERVITSKTKAIVPVHWSGKPCEMDAIDYIARSYNLPIVSDACHSIQAEYNGVRSGSLGDLSCFSFHPLKNLNVWGDGGIITTNSDELSNKLRLMRNHGLVGRDECQMFAYNSRLDTVQAVVARYLLEKKIDNITESRISNALYYDEQLKHIDKIKIPKRDKNVKQVFHLYQFLCEDRNELSSYLISKGIDAKIHYPVPMHLQPAASFLNHKRGDFPNAEYVSDHIISLPVHEFINRDEQDLVVNMINEFYEKYK